MNGSHWVKRALLKTGGQGVCRRGGKTWPVAAKVSPCPGNLTDGLELGERGRKSMPPVWIYLAGKGFQPRFGDHVFLNGREYRLMGALPYYFSGEILYWKGKAREVIPHEQ